MNVIMFVVVPSNKNYIVVLYSRLAPGAPRGFIAVSFPGGEEARPQKKRDSFLSGATKIMYHE